MQDERERGNEVNGRDAITVLKLYEDDAQGWDGSLSWRVHGEDDIYLAANCSDTFTWASGDFEEITADDIPLLRQCLADLREAAAPWYLSELYAARKRGAQVIKAVYNQMTAPVQKLFDDACDKKK